MATKLTRPSVLPLTPVAPHLRGSAVLRMVHEEQGGGAMVAPQWPPQEAAGGGGVSQRGAHDFMARCARAGGRSIEWPPRNEEGVAVRYGSNPALSSGQQQVAPPPVPPRPRYYPLNKAHSSAPNLLEDSADPKFGKTHPAKATAIPAHTTGDQKPVPPSRAGLPQPQSNMASQHSTTSSSSQVRVVSSSQSFQQIQPQPMREVSQSTQQEFTKISTGSPNLPRRTIPVQFDPSQQQEMLRQQMQQQQQQFMNQQQPFQQPHPQQFQQPPPQQQREFNVPIQMSSNTPTPQPSLNNPMTQTFGQGPPQGLPSQSMAYGGPTPSSMQHPPNATPPQSGFPPSQGYVPQPSSGQSLTRRGFGGSSGQVYPFESFQGPVVGDTTEWPPQQLPGDSDGNLTTVYPSNFKLRSEMPVEQEASKVYQSQPAFKCTKPIRMRGDNKWPPTGSQQDTSESEQVREFIKPRKQCKDYSGFFAQNALPSNYTGYRAPPGTQHVGSVEDDGTSEM